MPIRFATLADVPSLVEGGSRMHALTRFRSQPYDAQKVAQSFVDLITQGQKKYVFLVAGNAEGRVVGALIGVLEQQIFSNAFTASVMHFDVLPEARMGGYGLDSRCGSIDATNFCRQERDSERNRLRALAGRTSSIGPFS